MLDALLDLPVAQMTTVVCVLFVGVTWVGAIFIRPFFRVLVRSQPDLNTLLGNFVSIYGVFYGILMGLLAVAAYQNKAEVEHAITSEATSVAALFRNVSAYPDAVRAPLQETIRDYVQFVIEEEWPAMRQGKLAYGGMPLINRLQQQLSAYEPATSGQYLAHQEATQQFYRFFELRAVRLYSATTGIPGIMWYVVLLGALVSIFLVWLFEMSLIAEFFLGGLMSFFIGTMISLILVLDRPLRGEFGISPEVFRLVLRFINDMLGQPAG
jgi:hypothetical protein